MSLGRLAVVGTLWVAGSGYLMFSINFAMNILLVRLLRPEDFGIFVLALSLVELLFILAGWSFYLAIIQTQQEDQSLADTAFALLAGVGGILLLLIWIESAMLRKWYPGITVEVFVITGVIRTAMLPTGVYSAQLERKLNYRSLSLVRLVASNVSMVCALALAYLGAGVWSLVVREGIHTILLFLGYRRASCWRFGWRISTEALFKLLNFGGRMFLVRGLETAFHRADRLIIGIAGSQALLGYYHQARYLSELTHNAVSPAAGQVAFPTYSRLQGDKERLSRAYHLLTFFLVRTMLAVALAFAFFAESIVCFLFGENWRPAAQALCWMSLFAFCMPLYENIKQLFIATDHMGKAIYMMLWQLLALVPIMFIAFSRYGLSGAGWAVSSAMTLGLLTGLCYLRSLVEGSLVRDYWRAVLAAAGAAMLWVFQKEYFFTHFQVHFFFYLLLVEIQYIGILYLVENQEIRANSRYLLSRVFPERYTVDVGHL